MLSMRADDTSNIVYQPATVRIAESVQAFVRHEPLLLMPVDATAGAALRGATVRI